MKILFASDIHGSAYYCRRLLDIYKETKASRMVILGDILYHGPRNDLPKEYAPKEVIAMLNPLKDQIYAVRGNCDPDGTSVPDPGRLCAVSIRRKDILRNPWTRI